jgi:hypothetical protein
VTATAPYREPAAVDPGSPPRRYVPITRRQERGQRVLRSVPVLLLATAAFVFERPWLLAVGVGWGLCVVIVTRLHARSLNERLKALAGTLARDGDPALAARSLEALVADSRAYPGCHSIALLFLGIARARAGDADGALELLHVVQRAGWLAHRELWMAWLLPWLAQLHAARGELDLAQQWLALARGRLPESRHGSLTSAESLVALRHGKLDDALAIIEAYTAGAAAEDPVRQHFALLRAFARERAGRPLPASEVRVLVEARLASPGRVLPLEKWWAEFAEFVERHAPSRA